MTKVKFGMMSMKRKFLHFNQLGGSKVGLAIMFPNLPHPHMRMKMRLKNGLHMQVNVGSYTNSLHFWGIKENKS